MIQNFILNEFLWYNTVSVIVLLKVMYNGQILTNFAMRFLLRFLKNRKSSHYIPFWP